MKIDEPTLLCLSCHDGVSANISLNGTHKVLQGYNFGETSGNHPVSIQYNVSNKRLKNITDKNLLKGSNNDMVECTSCHNPHKKKINNEVNFLRYSNKNSELCYQCHSI
ncbi:MAG: hypothetical protein A3F91_09415 [Flavobacteria bacterium RIFCSPLOWO2_12_FULL_35_11]|nr:MAG: hypothetical protein A3F91_09415 [Flavobacteria bacterium RIFCSPLOWO2_12_FULL_35_11]